MGGAFGYRWNYSTRIVLTAGTDVRSPTRHPISCEPSGDSAVIAMTIAPSYWTSVPPPEWPRKYHSIVPEIDFYQRPEIYPIVFGERAQRHFLDFCHGLSGGESVLLPDHRKGSSPEWRGCRYYPRPCSRRRCPVRLGFRLVFCSYLPAEASAASRRNALVSVEHVILANNRR